jgi:copper(I)-binding protein
MAVAVFALLLSAAAWAGGISVSHAWIRLLPGNLPAGAYCTVANGSDHTMQLLGASAPDFKSAMLHKSVTQNGMDKMMPVEAIKIPAGKQFQFAPGGYHIMLMPPHAPLKPGDHVRINFSFADGSTTSAMFLVKGAGAMNDH